MRSSFLARRRAAAALITVREVSTRPHPLSAPPTFLATTAPSISRAFISSRRHQTQPLAPSFFPQRPIPSNARNPSPSSAAAATSSAPVDPGPERAQNPSTGTRAQKSPRSPAPPPTSTTTTTHYTFFPQTLPLGPPPRGRFAIDLRALKREFLSLQSRAHPDMAAHGDKSSAQALSAQINEAYKVLSSPLPRAQYLLHLRGEDVGLGEEGKTDDPELLMEVMETHHAIEDAATEEELEGIRRENEGRIEACEVRLGGLFDRGTEGGGEGEGDLLDELREETVKLKYWVAVREKIHEWEVQHREDVR